jgi:hypothetical protein
MIIALKILYKAVLFLIQQLKRNRITNMKVITITIIILIILNLIIRKLITMLNLKVMISITKIIFY